MYYFKCKYNPRLSRSFMCSYCNDFVAYVTLSSDHVSVVVCGHHWANPPVYVCWRLTLYCWGTLHNTAIVMTQYCKMIKKNKNL